MSPWLWLAAGIVLAALEMVVSGVYLLWIGLGGIATGILLLAIPGFSLQRQLVAFAVFAAAAAPVGALVYRRAGRSDAPTLNRRGEQLVGRTVTLDEAIVNGAGRARIGDTVWRVLGPDLPAGSRVRITGSEGAALSVVGEASGPTAT
jgi:membrane protein implicated in regulation of membrane protease activity